jgi:hypothetical protein
MTAFAVAVGTVFFFFAVIKIFYFLTLGEYFQSDGHYGERAQNGNGHKKE